MSLIFHSSAKPLRGRSARKTLVSQSKPFASGLAFAVSEGRGTSRPAYVPRDWWLNPMPSAARSPAAAWKLRWWSEPPTTRKMSTT